MRKITTEILLQRLKTVYGDKYDLSKVEYTNSWSMVTLICPEHGPWDRMADRVLKNGCPKCAYRNIGKNRTYNKLKTTEEFIKEATEFHGGIYDYSLVEYINTDTKISIICPTHGIFTQLPWGHLKYGCRPCNVHVSKVEKRWLKSLNIPTLITQYRLPTIKFTVDGYDPLTNTVYEFYGDYWHGNPNKFPANKINVRTPKKKSFGQLYRETIDRENIIKNNGYNLISIWESEFKQLG